MNHNLIDDELFAAFCRHLSASINVIDVLYKLQQLKSGTVVSEDDPIILVSRDPELFALLKEFNYREFVEACVTRIQIEPSCYDVFLSEVDEDAFKIFVGGFKHLAPQAKVEVTEKGFVVHSPMLIADLILPVISRVHEEVLRSLDHFVKMLVAVGNNPKSLFLNAKSPTPESQFLQLWVALKLKIPTEPGGDVIAVV